MNGDGVLIAFHDQKSGVPVTGIAPHEVARVLRLTRPSARTEGVEHLGMHDLKSAIVRAEKRPVSYFSGYIAMTQYGQVMVLGNMEDIPSEGSVATAFGLPQNLYGKRRNSPPDA